MNIFKKNLFFTILFFVTALYYIPMINVALAPYDEAVILVGAERILNGQIPHRDFSTEYPAGQLYVLAGLFKVFGTSVTTERVYDLLIRTLLSIVVFLMIRILASNGTAFAGWLMSLIWLQHSSFAAYPVYPSILFIFTGIYLMLHYMKEQQNHYLLFCAVSIVFATLFRHDFGAYAAIVISGILIFRRIVGLQSWTPFALFVTSGLLAGLPVIIYFFMNSALKYMINDLILIPMAFLDFQDLPYPPLSRWNLPFYVFPIVLVIGLITSLIQIKRNKETATGYGLLLISLVGIVFLNQVRIRSDRIHLMPAAITGILLAPILFHTFHQGLSLGRKQYRSAFVLFITIFVITLSRPIEVISGLVTKTNGYRVKNVNPDIGRARHTILNLNRNNAVALRDTVLYIKNNTSTDEHIYVGVKNHDQFVFNDAVIYFLAGRSPATRYHVLNPGVQTTLKVQEEMVNELKDKHVTTVVLVPRNWNEPNLSGVDQKIDVLDSYISNNYELKEKFGMYEIWRKKTLRNFNF